MNPAFLLDHLRKNYAINDPKLVAVLETRGARGAFHIKSSQSQFVAKIIESPLTIFSALNLFQPSYFKFPKITANMTGEYVTKFYNSFVVLMEFVEGNEIIPPTFKFYSDYGKIVADLHKLPTNNLLHGESLNSQVKKLQKFVTSLKISNEIKDSLLCFLGSVSFPAALTNGIIHGDISYYNILKNENQYYLIDVDDMIHGQIVCDLGFVLAYSFILTESDFSKLNLKSTSHTCFLIRELAEFFKKYLQINKLSRSDLAAIVDCALLVCIKNIYSKEDDQLIKVNYERFCSLGQHRKTIDEIIHRD